MPATKKGTPSEPTQSPEQDTGQTQRNRSFGTRSLLGSSSSGRVADIKNKMVELVDAYKKEHGGTELDNFGFVVLNEGNFYPVILVTYKSEGKIFYHSLVVLDSNFKMPNSVTRMNGPQPITVMVTPGDALDAMLEDMANQAISRHYGTAIDQIYPVDGSLIPADFDLENTSNLKDLLSSSIDALWAEANVVENTHEPFVIPEFIKSVGGQGFFQVQMVVNTSPGAFVDEAGQPVHQQISLVLRYKTQGSSNRRQSMHVPNDDQEIGRVSGYIDFDLVNRQSNPMTGDAGPLFVPNFIITEVVASEKECATTDFILALILSSIAVNKDMFWLSAFRTTFREKGDISSDDIGMLNLEGGVGAKQGNPGKPIDFTRKDVDVRDMINFAHKVVVPNTFNVSIDVPQASPSTWYTSVFRAAAGVNGPEIQAQALRRIGNAAHALTNGSFQSTEVSNGIMLPLFNLYHGGYYTVNNQKRDLRSITNYLSVASWAHATNQGLPMIQQYTESLYNAAVPADVRASMRKSIFLDQLNVKPVYLQYIHRLTFSNVFLDRLAAAASSVGFSPIPDSNVGQEDFAQRSYASMQNAVNIANFVGSHQFTGGTTHGGFGRTFFG